MRRYTKNYNLLKKGNRDFVQILLFCTCSKQNELIVITKKKKVKKKLLLKNKKMAIYLL